jgi:hypothetical protein
MRVKSDSADAVAHGGEDYFLAPGDGSHLKAMIVVVATLAAVVAAAALFVRLIGL